VRQWGIGIASAFWCHQPWDVQYSRRQMVHAVRCIAESCVLAGFQVHLTHQTSQC